MPRFSAWAPEDVSGAFGSSGGRSLDSMCSSTSEEALWASSAIRLSPSLALLFIDDLAIVRMRADLRAEEPVLELETLRARAFVPSSPVATERFGLERRRLPVPAPLPSSSSSSSSSYPPSSCSTRLFFAEGSSLRPWRAPGGI